MNNIELLRADMERNKNKVAPAEMFTGIDQATDADRNAIAGNGRDGKSVLVETSVDGRKSSRMLDDVMDEIYEKKIAGDIRAANVGDISSSIDIIREELADRATRAANSYSIDGNVDREAISKASEDAIRAIGEYMKTGVPDSNAVSAVLSRMSLSKITRILPKNFVSLYATDDEISSGSRAAKDRIVSALAYVIATGPELDELNGYIEREQKAMAVTQRLAQCHVDLMEMLKSRDRADDLIERAKSIDPHEPTVWDRYLKDPRAIHSEFARSAAIHMDFVDAYTKLLDEYPDDAEARKLIGEQITESKMKISAYMDVFELSTLRQVITGLHLEFSSMAAAGKLTQRRLDDMAIRSIERIRRSKQNVPFPAYDPALGKRPKELYRKYKADFSMMVGNYNSTLLKARAGFKDGENPSDNVRPVALKGHFDRHVATAFTVLLLIAFGRLMKRLSDTDKYNAIMLDNYFRMWCKLGTDIEVMSSVWELCEPTVKEMIDSGKT